MMAKIRLRSGSKIDVTVRDVSPIGCMVERGGWSPQADDRVLVQLDGLGFQPAAVVWVDEDHVGISLEQLLHEVVLERLKSTLARAA